MDKQRMDKQPVDRQLDVRKAVLADLDDMAAPFDGYRQFQKQASDLDAARAFLRARLDHAESVLFIARDGNAPVGFAQLYPSFSSIALARVFVLNDLFVNSRSVIMRHSSCSLSTSSVRSVLNAGKAFSGSRFSTMRRHRLPANSLCIGKPGCRC